MFLSKRSTLTFTFEHKIKNKSIVPNSNDYMDERLKKMELANNIGQNNIEQNIRKHKIKKIKKLYNTEQIRFAYIIRDDR